jgi:hypothetical protein
VVDYPNFKVILWCKVEIVNLKMINFDIKVGNENDKRIISDIIQTSVRVYSALIAQE